MRLSHQLLQDLIILEINQCLNDYKSMSIFLNTFWLEEKVFHMNLPLLNSGFCFQQCARNMHSFLRYYQSHIDQVFAVRSYQILFDNQCKSSFSTILSILIQSLEIVKKIS